MAECYQKQFDVHHGLRKFLLIFARKADRQALYREISKTDMPFFGRSAEKKRNIFLSDSMLATLITVEVEWEVRG